MNIQSVFGLIFAVFNVALAIISAYCLSHTEAAKMNVVKSTKIFFVIIVIYWGLFYLFTAMLEWLNLYLPFATFTGRILVRPGITLTLGLIAEWSIRNWRINGIRHK